MEVKKEKIAWTNKVAGKILQIQADADVIVPDIKPDIRKILQVYAHAKITGCELQNDRVLVNGVVNYNIVYTPDDESESLQSMKAQTPFTDVVSFKGITSDMKGDFEPEIAEVNYRIINGRKFAVKSIVEIAADISEAVELERVCAIEDQNVQMKKEEVEYLAKTSECEKTFIVNDKIVIPESEASVGEILKITPKINEYSVKVISNKVILKGEEQLVCTYTDAVDNNIISTNNVVPFTEILDVDGIKADDLCNVKVLINDCSYNCEENIDGETRGLEIQTEICVKIAAMREVKTDMLSDCYAISSKLNTKSTIANLSKKIADVDYQDTFKSQIKLSDDEPEIERIYDVFSKVYVDEIEQVKDKLNVSGTIDNYVLYVTTQKDTPIYCAKNEIKFTESFDCEGETSVSGDFNARALNVSYVLNDNKNVELRVNVKMDGLIYNNVEKSIITDVTSEELTIRPDIASITVYFVQENDTLWEIAKKYLTTTEAIRKINDGIDGDLKTGMQLIIPKCKA